MIALLLIPLAIFFFWLQSRYREAKGEPPVIIPRWVTWACGILAIALWAALLLG